ncbi:hypothetical protein COCVIDRAFT_85607, partial [Bipolaris victoriae FI3]
QLHALSPPPFGLFVKYHIFTLLCYKLRSTVREPMHSYHSNGHAYKCFLFLLSICTYQNIHANMYIPSPFLPLTFFFPLIFLNTPFFFLHV